MSQQLLDNSLFDVLSFKKLLLTCLNLNHYYQADIERMKQSYLQPLTLVLIIIVISEVKDGQGPRL